MEVTAIGVGNGGSKIVDALVTVDEEVGRGVVADAYALNTAESDFRALDHLPESNRLLLTSPEMRPSGTGNKPELGADLLGENLTLVKNAIASAPWHATDALVVVAALGGGTGSGGAPILADHLRAWYDVPVFGLGVLPNERGHMELNAARSFMEFGQATDNLFLVDNAVYLSPDESIRENYGRINRDIARKWVTFLSAGERAPDSAEMYVDVADLFAVLEMGGVSVLGYASREIDERHDGLLDRFRTNGQPVERDRATRALVDTVKTASRSLTMDVDPETAEGVALLVTGPADRLTQRGIDESRQFLQDLTGAQRIAHGDDPREGAREVSAAVLFSNVGAARRIDELKQRGKEAKREMERRREERARKQQELFSDPDGELGSVTGSERPRPEDG
ncbi:cell division protein [Halobaculum sp. CBA1158]|uniref:cell division protein n=1 Tax=Halobaculum sp. CBA1158 TaxID=2904243 RepID=UPI001F24A526|nr:cell division protein [Halobaculum sp. CBA1158]UIO99186.1 cell division protein [Halobaculum sp. CBA1158]